jgi:hypothetical protein
VIEYKLVGFPSLGTLEHRVNQLLAEGWTLQGGLTARSAHPEADELGWYGQALVRERLVKNNSEAK